jgi:DNA-binding MarR family transcriptional regulator
MSNAHETLARDARDDIHPDVRLLLDEFRLEAVGSHLLRRAHFMAEELFAREFADESLTPRQKAALVIVYQQPGLNQNALADRLFMDRNTVAEMVKRLAATGLLHRSSAQTDQRAYQLFLAPGGAELLNRVMPRIPGALPQMLALAGGRAGAEKRRRLAAEFDTRDQIPAGPVDTARIWTAIYHFMKYTSHSVRYPVRWHRLGSRGCR